MYEGIIALNQKYHVILIPIIFFMPVQSDCSFQHTLNYVWNKQQHPSLNVGQADSECTSQGFFFWLEKIQLSVTVCWKKSSALLRRLAVYSHRLRIISPVLLWSSNKYGNFESLL